MPDNWDKWHRGRPKANLKNGEPPPWTNKVAKAEEVATALWEKIPFSIAGDTEWSIERDQRSEFWIYTLHIKAGYSELVLSQIGNLNQLHGMKILHGGISFGIGVSDQLFVQIDPGLTR